MNVQHPDLSGADILSVDIETYDPNIEDGPGMYRNDGCILGVSISDGTFSEYYNIGHHGITEEEQRINSEYVKSIMSSDVPKVGANLMYDIDWMENGKETQWKVNGVLHDIQIAEPLLDEYSRHYSLEALSQKYLGIGKQKEKPQSICDSHGWTGDFRKHLWKMKWEDVRDYAKGDADQPLKILSAQRLELENQDLRNLYDMEMSLFRLLLKMRKVGVRIDDDARERASTVLHKEVNEIRSELWKEYGAFNWKSSQQIAEIFDMLGISYEKNNKTGNPCLDKDHLEQINHPIVKKILKGRGSELILNNYIDGAFVDFVSNGRIHGQFKQLAQDEGGTCSGRFSAAKPQLQGIPSRDEEHSSMCRSCFKPEENCSWGKIDYSQIEYRIIAHYATGERSEEIRKRYKEDPHTDYHKLIMDWTGVDRFTAKRLNFGMAYYMGPSAMSRKFHYTLDEATELQSRYMENVPFMQPTRSWVVQVGEGRGYIKTVLGRRARVTKEMRGGGFDPETGEKIKKRTYVLFNRLIQGSAADILKKSMSDSWKAGIYDVLIPHITVHDEMGVSVPNTREGIEAYVELKHIMETCVPMNVPIVADAEIGTTWGTTKEITDWEVLYENDR